ncbi:hypothetical protein CCACVL1_02413 [Corchorus capsularis]|uniref:Uncharacterized protein n=1 Tax=Corchorus capsularis TaxID=210143 RepID=A0A1R3K8V4_COCAP|nr:hypothetical protein CCACVL1_02413 [Corchorus capsularis]
MVEIGTPNRKAKELMKKYFMRIYVYCN